MVTVALVTLERRVATTVFHLEVLSLLTGYLLVLEGVLTHDGFAHEGARRARHHRWNEHLLHLGKDIGHGGTRWGTVLGELTGQLFGKHEEVSQVLPHLYTAGHEANWLLGLLDGDLAEDVYVAIELGHVRPEHVQVFLLRRVSLSGVGLQPP